MRDFTTEEIAEIKAKHKNLGLSKILFEEKYSDCQIYTMSSKPPMDEWEFEGAFLFEVDAMEQYDKVIESWGYNGMGISVDISPISMKDLQHRKYEWQSKVLSSLLRNSF